MLSVLAPWRPVRKRYSNLKDKSSNMKKTSNSSTIDDPGMVVNLYTLERLRKQQHIVMTNNRLNYEILLKEAREKDIMVLSLTPFCNKWYKDDIQPHSGKQCRIMQLKDDVVDMLQNAIKNRINLYTDLIPQRKNTYKRSMIHYQRLVSMINQMERILIDEWYKRHKTSQQYDAFEINATKLVYKVISGEWGSKTGWHAELVWTSPSGQEFAITV